MTSQSMTLEQKQNFKNFFHRYIYGQSNGYNTLDSFDSIPNLKQRLVDKGLIELRKHPNLTQKEQLHNNAVRYAEVFRLSRESNNPELAYREADLMTEVYGFTLNTKAFIVTIELLGNQHQVQHWKNLVFTGKVIGGYGQTQLGHGSNVQNLQAEALFDQQRDSFILNSPKVTSVKFWPGCFGIYSTHCVFQAKTIVKGENIGIQTFIVPMRDLQLNPLEGIQSGDIGPKIGFSRVDNGYLKLNNVVVPRQNMLSRYIQVSRDGTVNGKDNKQAMKYGYGSMLNLRVKLVIAFALAYTYNPAIIQYEIYEKNGKLNDGFSKKKLLQAMCSGLGQIIANNYVLKQFRQFLQSLKQKDYSTADKLLIVCHIISSTFKALSSWKSEQTARQCVTMNEYGTFNASFLPKLFSDVIPSVTYEGDNSVLLQQTAKFILMKQQDNELKKPDLLVDANDLNQICSVLKYITSCEVRNLKGLIQKSVEQGKDFKTVWNEIYQLQILEVSKLWGRFTFVKCAIQTLKSISSYKQFFTKVVQVFASTLLNESSIVVFYGFNIKESTAWQELTPDQIQVMRDLNRPFRRDYEQLKFETRGDKTMADWIYSKL